MRKIRRGFTLIEVALFLAVSGALFVGVMAGMQGAISEQEKNDAVQNFAEFLRSAYSEAENVQNLVTGGRSEKAIYGKLITFGENTNLLGNPNTDREIFMYTVVGDVRNNTSGGTSTLEILQKLQVGVTEVKDSKLQLMGISEGYKMRWDTYLQRKCTVEGEVVKVCGEDAYKQFEGSILIARQPNTGTIFTYYSPRVVQVNQTIKNYVGGGSDSNPFLKTGALDVTGQNYLTANEFSNANPIDFCINVSGAQNGTERTNVRIIQGASNASGIEIVGSEMSLCDTH